MITDDEFLDWLEDHDVMRCILVEADCNSAGQEITRTFSSKGFLNYDPIVSDGVQFKESLDLNSSAGLSFGGVTLDNFDGSYTYLLDDVWVRRDILVLIGDVAWHRDDYRIIFKGLIDDIDSTSADTLQIRVMDKMQRLNYPISETKLGGGTINKDRLLPLAFGECFNVTPLLVDPSDHEYMVNHGVTADIIEGRDDDVPVQIEKFLHKGTFSLSQNRFGVITASVQGDMGLGYEKSVAPIIQRIVRDFGKEGQRFGSEDIDHENFEAFDLQHPEAVGLYVDSRLNVIDAITQLADSVGAQVLPSREGLLRIIQIRAPLTGNVPVVENETQFTTTTGDVLVSAGSDSLLSQRYSETRVLTEHDIEHGGLSIVERVPVKSTIKLGYCKNWTVQKEVTTGIPQNHKDLFSQQWISKTATDFTVSQLYQIDEEPVQKDTLLVNGVDAQKEADRLLEIYSTQRTIYKIEGYIHLVFTELGDDIILKFNEFGLDNGKYGIVLSIDVDWVAMRVSLEVLV